MIHIGESPATIDSPAAHLTACHRRIEQRLDTLVNAAGHIDNDAPAALAAIRGSIRFMDTSGALHTRDEEDSLFPRLRAKLSPARKEFLDSLEAQHVQAEEIYSQLKQCAAGLSEQPSAESVSSYRRLAEQLRTLYRSHIRAEDEILTVTVGQTLAPEEIEDVAREMRARRQHAR